MEFLTQEQYEERLAGIKESTANDTYLHQHNLSDYKIFLQNKINELILLEGYNVIDEDSLLSKCVEGTLRNVLIANMDIISSKGIGSDFHKITLKQFAKLPILDLLKMFNIKQHHIKELQKILKVVYLNFN